MKKFSLYMFVVLMFFTVIPVLQSCDDNDGHSLGNFMVTMATVQKEQGSVYPYFVLDNGKTIWVSASAVAYEGLESGQRVIGNFTILADGKDGFDYLARVNNYTVVLTKDVVNLTEENQDSIGNSKTTITDMWVGADFLNVEFWMVFPSDEKHMVNLIDNRMVAPDEDGYAHLEFRYNNMGDEKGEMIRGIVSFDLENYGPSNKNLKGLKVKINSIKNGDKVYTYDYPEGESNEKNNLSEESNSEQLK